MKRAGKTMAMLSLLLLTSLQGDTQEWGMAFSYFIPENGYFSNPVAPLSFRDLGFDMGKHFSITSGLTLYRMAGMGITAVPFDSDEPLMGPLFAPMVPLELDVHIPVKKIELLFKGGGFCFYGLGYHLNYGNIDRAIREYEGWELVNANFKYDNKLGYGYFFGSEFIMQMNNKISIALKGSYFIGGSKLNLRGYYSGYTGNNTPQYITKNVQYPDAKLDFTGLELGIGIGYRMR